MTSAALLCLLSLVLVPSATAAPGVPGQPAQQGLDHRNVRVCDRGPTGTVHCTAVRRDTVDRNGNVQPNVTPPGLSPAQLQSAYNIASTASNPPNGPLVAIVDAYDHPYAENDLNVYRTQFGIPACTTANKCFQKVDQNGTTRYPRADPGWAQEISLDLDMVSAACPNCRILLVEAQSASFTDLAAAVNTAAQKSALAISNSYGGSDFSSSSLASAYNHPGVAITASTGDAGYEVEAPASFTNVVAVGGTSLTRATGTARGWTETAWNGAGSGCSTLNGKPAWQTGATKCTGKANADVAAVADPSTGVAVYDSYAYQGVKGWMQFGGTSASAPIIASLYARAGNIAAATNPQAAQYTWAHTGALNDVTGGSNGTCTTAAWCTAGTGWDGPTGLGTPNGLGAF